MLRDARRDTAVTTHCLHREAVRPSIASGTRRRWGASWRKVCSGGAFLAPVCAGNIGEAYSRLFLHKLWPTLRGACAGGEAVMESAAPSSANLLGTPRALQTGAGGCPRPARDKTGGRVSLQAGQAGPLGGPEAQRARRGASAALPTIYSLIHLQPQPQPRRGTRASDGLEVSAVPLCHSFDSGVVAFMNFT